MPDRKTERPGQVVSLDPQAASAERTVNGHKTKLAEADDAPPRTPWDMDVIAEATERVRSMTPEEFKRWLEDA